LVGLLLLWFAAPRTIAYAKLGYGEKVIAALSRGETPSPLQISAAIAHRRDALTWVDLPDAWIDLDSLYLAMARRAGLSMEDRAALLNRSISSFERGLGAAPYRPFAWLQLAQARLLKNPASKAVDPLLRMSIKIGPYESRLIGQRVRLGFAARAILSPETTTRVSEGVRLWAKYDAWRLADWARPNFALPWVRAALQDQPVLDRQFLLNYLRLPPR